MNKRLAFLMLLNLLSGLLFGQKVILNNQEFLLRNVTGSVIEFQGEKVMKLERDLSALPFDENRLEATVDDRHYARLTNLDFENGTIEVKMYSQLQNPVPNNYKSAQGFIGVYFRIDEKEESFDAIYLRPRVGRSNNQFFRNHTVQYFSYPNYKFDTLRKIAPAKYEGSAPVGLHEWITMRIEVNGQRAEMYINDAKYSNFIVDSMLGKNALGAVGLYVDIGTIGYFKDLKITPRQNRADEMANEWERAKAFTKEYLEAMPEKGYASKPTREMRSFAGQMLHLADANYAFVSAATGKKIPAGAGESEKIDDQSKINVTRLVLASYDFVIDNIRKMKPEQLNESVKLFGQFELTSEQALKKCFEHQTHHRGQATAYLRLAGVKPPPEKLF
jgi:uncharacterized damage-inducible protein DinB